MSSKVNPSAVQDAIQVIAQAEQTLLAEKAALSGKRDALAKRIEALYALPLRSEDVQQMLLAAVDSAAAQYPTLAGLDTLMVHLAGPRGRRPVHGRKPGGYDASAEMSEQSGAAMCLRDWAYINSSGNGQASTRLLGLAGFPSATLLHVSKTKGAQNDNADEHRSLAQLCFFFGEVVKAKLAEYFERNYRPRVLAIGSSSEELSMSAPDRLITIDQWTEQIEAIEQDIARVEREISALPNNDRTRREVGIRLGFPDV